MRAISSWFVHLSFLRSCFSTSPLPRRLPVLAFSFSGLSSLLIYKVVTDTLSFPSDLLLPIIFEERPVGHPVIFDFFFSFSYTALCSPSCFLLDYVPWVFPIGVRVRGPVSKSRSPWAPFSGYCVDTLDLGHYPHLFRLIPFNILPFFRTLGFSFLLLQRILRSFRTRF